MEQSTCKDLWRIMESEQRARPKTFQIGLSISQSLLPKVLQRTLQNIHQLKKR